MNTTICRETLHTLYGSMNEDVIDFFSEFIIVYPEFKSQCLESYRQNDLEGLKKALHQHAPGFTYVGFPGLTQGMKKLEMNCSKASSVAEINKQFHELMLMADSAASEVKKELNTLRPVQ